MKMFVLAAAFALATPALASNWEFDPAHSRAQFKVRHMMISNVTGAFTGVKGKVVLDDGDVAKSNVEATIDTATINTDNAKRDEHLKSPDFFDVKKFPTMTFKAKKIKAGAGGALTVDGMLMMHGTEKPVTLAVTNLTPEVKSPFGDVRRGLTATTKINRSDFGLTWNKALETGGVMVSDDVEITIDAELVKGK